jgi:hypothetical protein
MAVDKSYGSGNPRSAANSRARQRVAKGQFTKGKKGIGATIRSQRAKQAASPLGQLADTLLGFALPVGKVKAAAMGLRAAGKTAAATALEARLGAKEAGKFFGGTGKKSQGLGLPMDRAVDVGGRARDFSESVFPRLPNSSIPGSRRSFDIYEDPLLEGAGRFARGTKRGNKLAKAIEKNEVQQGFYIGSREAIKRAAFNSTRPRSNLPKAK